MEERQKLLRQRKPVKAPQLMLLRRVKLTGAGLVRLISIAAVVAVAAHADGGGLGCRAAVGGALQAQTRALG